MPKKPRVLPHPSTLVEMNPEDDILFRERYKTLKSIVYEVEDENNLIAFKSAQTRARIAALKVELAQQQEMDVERFKKRARAAENPASRPRTTTPPHSPPRRPSHSHSHSHSSAASAAPSASQPEPEPNQGLEQPQARYPGPQLSLEPIPTAPPLPPAPSVPSAQSAESVAADVMPTPAQSQGPESVHSTSNGNGHEHVREESNASSARTSVTGRARAPLVGPNGEEDELMSD